MGVLFLILAHAGNALSMLSSLFFIIAVLGKNDAMKGKDILAAFEKERGVFTALGFVFVALYWFWYSGMTTEKCLSAYHTINGICTFWGCAWVIYAFLNIFMGLMMVLANRKDDVNLIAVFRKPCFVVGAVYFVLAFLFRGL